MSGFRSTIAASLLRSYGFSNILNLVDGIDVWSTELETESAGERLTGAGKRPGCGDHPD